MRPAEVRRRIWAARSWCVARRQRITKAGVVQLPGIAHTVVVSAPIPHTTGVERRPFELQIVGGTPRTTKRTRSRVAVVLRGRRWRGRLNDGPDHSDRLDRSGNFDCGRRDGSLRRVRTPGYPSLSCHPWFRAEYNGPLSGPPRPCWRRTTHPGSAAGTASSRRISCPPPSQECTSGGRRRDRVKGGRHPVQRWGREQYTAMRRLRKAFEGRRIRTR